MNKSIIIFGGILAIGIIVNVFDNDEHSYEILSGIPIIQPTIQPTLQTQEVSFDQVYPTIDKYVSNVEQIIQNCQGDKRCVITKDGRKWVEIKNFNDLIDNPKIYAK